MRFRGSMFIPFPANNPDDRLWYEVDKFMDKFILTEVTENLKDSFRQASLAVRFIDFTKQLVGQTPSAYPPREIDSAHTVETALEKIFVLEKKKLTYLKLADIGNHPYSVPHYINLMANHDLPRIDIPPELVAATSAYTQDIAREFLHANRTHISGKVIEKAERTRALYNNFSARFMHHV